MPTVSLAEADAPLVLALDLGTSSLRALVFDRSGRAVAGSEEQLPHALRTTSDGGVETDAPPLFDLLLRCVDGALVRAADRAAEIAAVGVSCFWHSLLGLDRRDEPVTPLLMWADTRSASDAAGLRRELGDNAAGIQARTGCRFHSSYWPAKLRWLAASRPQIVRGVARWVSFAEYVGARLHDDPAASFSSASGTGLLDVHRLTWDAELAALLGVALARLPRLVDRDEVMPPLRPEFAARWPGLAGIPWYPALGDGACANVGSGAVAPDRIALTVGTSGALRIVVPADSPRPPVPPDLWSYRMDGERYVVGGAVSNGGNVLAWLAGLVGVDLGPADMEAAASLPPDGHGLTMLPFVAGERAPGWHDQASGVIAGLTLATRAEHLLRAGMEAVAYRLARVYDDVRPLAADPHTIVANGGAILRSPTWLQIVADTLGHEVLALPPEEEASARGAALCALEAIGALPEANLGSAPEPAAGAQSYGPDAERHASYRAGLERQAQLEAALFATDGRDSVA